MNLHIKGCQSNDWIKLNPGQVGFYRVNYSAEMLQRLTPAIQTLKPVDRLGLASDLFALAYAGYSATTNFLDLLNGYKEEMNCTVWNDIDSNLGCLGILMQNTDAIDQYKKFILKLYKPVGDKLGWEPKDGEGEFFFFAILCFLQGVMWLDSYSNIKLYLCNRCLKNRKCVSISNKILQK